VDEKERLNVLEQALAQMLKPMKNIPFSVIIKSLADQQVVPISKTDPNDIDLLKKLGATIQLCAAELKSGDVPVVVEN
jgi:hypothetical protein